jgi:sugar phosphate isomerase/epimerase
MKETPIYIGSILLEPNRWKGSKEPSYKVSAWLERFRAAGLDGIELWENHYLKVSDDEKAALRSSAVPMRIFNTYAEFSGSGDELGRIQAADSAITLQSAGIKFNVGKDTKRTSEYLDAANFWAKRLPASVRLLCECHPGTVLETPEAAEKAFRDTWRDERFQAIVHPFSTPPDVLREWMKRLKGRVTHAHVQMRGEQNRPVRLDRRPREAREALQILREGGFSGSFTLEFTEGTSTPNDRPDFLWENALADLKFLRENGSV